MNVPMKKLLSVFLPLLYLFNILLSLAFPRRIFASATTSESAYACVLQDDVFFYSDQLERKGLFILPKTYFVKILSHGEIFCQVEYGAATANSKTLVGYCKTDELEFVTYTPDRPYLTQTLDITYKIDGMTGAPFLTSYTVTCAYYGNYAVGSELYAYVLQNDKFGYLPLPTGFTYPENSEYYDKLAAETPDETPPAEEPAAPKKESGNPVQTAILILLCVLIPILAALIVRPNKKAPVDPEE